jgi:chromosome segregation ATPase
MNNHNCSTCTNDTCQKGAAKTANTKTTVNKKSECAQSPYGYYSRVLSKPFDTVAELREAENAYYAAQMAAEAKASTKNSDAQKVEDAFKALNAARKAYRENIEQLTDEYSEALANLKKAYEAGRADQQKILTAAEDAYTKALEDFTSKYPEYTLKLQDGDTVATISGKTKVSSNKVDSDLQKFFELLFDF